MATKKISQLTTLTSGSVTSATDVLPIVDSDASITKKITVDDLAGAMSSTLLEAKYQDTFFVSPSGSNSTGEKGNISLPFATIAGARNAATGSSGYNRLIYVFPGTYEEQGLAYSGSFYFSPGATLQAPVQASATEIPFFSVGTDNIQHVNIFGKGNFISQKSTDNDDNSNILSVIGTGSAYLEANYIFNEKSNGIFLQDSASAILKANEYEIADGYMITQRDYSVATIDLDTINHYGAGAFAYGMFFRQGSSAGFFGQSTVNANKIISTDSTFLACTKMGVGARVDINANTILVSGSSDEFMTCINSFGEHYINVNGNFNTTKKIYRTYPAASNSGMRLILTGTAKVSGSQFLEFTSNENNAEITSDMWVEVTGSTNAITHNGSTGANLFLNRGLTNETVDGNGIIYTGTGNLVVDNYKITLSGSFISPTGYSISGSSTQDILVMGQLSSNASTSTGLNNTGPGLVNTGYSGSNNLTIAGATNSTASFGSMVLESLPTTKPTLSGSLWLSGSAGQGSQYLVVFNGI